MSITGMHCDHCCRAVRNALAALAGVGVRATSVGHARVTLDEAVTSRQDVFAAIRHAGDFDIAGFTASDPTPDAD